MFNVVFLTGINDTSRLPCRHYRHHHRAEMPECSVPNHLPGHLLARQKHTLGKQNEQSTKIVLQLSMSHNFSQHLTRLTKELGLMLHKRVFVSCNAHISSFSFYLGNN